MQQYSTRSNQTVLDVCLNTYGSLNLLGKLMKENGVYNPLYNTSNNSNFVFDETLITDRLIYNQLYKYATATQESITARLMDKTKRLTFRIGTDKPNGNTVQDNLLKQGEALLVFVGGTEVNEHATGFNGYTFNKTTGTIDFTNIGGVSNVIVDILYNSGL